MYLAGHRCLPLQVERGSKSVGWQERSSARQISLEVIWGKRWLIRSHFHRGRRPALALPGDGIRSFSPNRVQAPPFDRARCVEAFARIPSSERCLRMPEQGGELRTVCVVAGTFYRRWLSLTTHRASLNECISTNTERLGSVAGHVPLTQGGQSSSDTRCDST